MTKRAKTVARMLLLLVAGLAIAGLSDHGKALSHSQPSAYVPVSSEDYLIDSAFGDTVDVSDHELFGDAERLHS